MKKIFSVILSALFVAVASTSCGKNARIDSPPTDKLKIVTTIFPEYDWVREIIGENAETVDLTLLLKNGVDLHSYQPSTEDLIAISQADVFVYVGGHSDTWVADALKNAANPDRITINLFDVLDDTLKPLVISEGMEHHHDEHDHNEHSHDDHDHNEHDHDEHEHHHDDSEKDEHVWLSLPRAQAAVRYIVEQIAKADPANADMYLANAEKYENELETLHQEYQEVVNTGKMNTIVFTDRFPFFYMADDYGLNYYAAFTGCSAEAEASFETVALLAQKIDELALENVITIENRTHKIPETVIESTKTKDQNILVLDSLQSVTQKQIEEGLTYLDVMKSNLNVLKTALQ